VTGWARGTCGPGFGGSRLPELGPGVAGPWGTGDEGRAMEGAVPWLRSEVDGIGRVRRRIARARDDMSTGEATQVGVDSESALETAPNIGVSPQSDLRSVASGISRGGLTSTHVLSSSWSEVHSSW
jgi:hypothetical protein